MRQASWLVLADGTTFEGEAIGYLPEGGVSTGEVVFNTVLSGYQEVITDPSYAGQIIAFTYTHIGNYGVNPSDDEGRRPFCRGIIVRELTARPSNWRSAESLEHFLVRHHVPGIAGIDTRRLTRHLRNHGALPAAFGTGGAGGLDVVAAAAGTAKGTDGTDYVSEVTTAQRYRVAGAATGRRIIAYDFGIKTSIVAQLAELGDVEVVPASTSAEAVLAANPHGVFLSNGPGDPAALPDHVATIAALLGRVPVFGICLGHQLLGHALGGTTFKLPFGHHGGNHPVRRDGEGVPGSAAAPRQTVEIASHNHNYAIDPATLGADVEITHVNLNDGTVAGLAVPDRWCYSVQYHPEAGPGPHDPRYLFAMFAELMDRFAARTATASAGAR